MYRLRKHHLKYLNDSQGEKDCPFCNPDPKQIAKKIGNFYLLKNIYGYDLWDLRKVTDHLMVVPQEHSKGFFDMEDKKIKEFYKIIKTYSENGYDLLVRSTSSPRKSQPHFHAHLIKTEGKIFKMVHFIKDPYYLFFK